MKLYVLALTTALATATRNAACHCTQSTTAISPMDISFGHRVEYGAHSFCRSSQYGCRCILYTKAKDTEAGELKPLLQRF